MRNYVSSKSCFDIRFSVVNNCSRFSMLLLLLLLLLLLFSLLFGGLGWVVLVFFDTCLFIHTYIYI